MNQSNRKAYTPDQLFSAEQFFKVLAELPKDNQSTVIMMANAFMEGMKAQERAAANKSNQPI